MRCTTRTLVPAMLVSGVLLLICGDALAQVHTLARVEFELATEPGFPLNGAREWTRLFSGFEGTRVQIRSARSTDGESVRNMGSEERPSYKVAGLLTRRNRLRLPGAREFTLGDRKQIASWIEELRTEGTPEERATRIAFGLSSEETVSFHSRMAAPIGFDTKGRRSGDVARQIVKELGAQFEVTPTARQAFGRNELVGDDLDSVSIGTALAATLRPLGLATAPRKRAGRIELLIADADELDEWWPIGWPRQQPPYKMAPSMFERLEVSIEKTTPAKKSLDAIQGRVKVPFLYDHNSMARLDIDLEATFASFSRRRVTYKKVLDSILFQSRLKSELRTDDAGTTFLWITTQKKM